MAYSVHVILYRYGLFPLVTSEGLIGWEPDLIGGELDLIGWELDLL
jgi:hypothetical protein